MLNTVITGAIIMASIIISCVGAIRLSVLLAVREIAEKMNTEMRTAAA